MEMSLRSDILKYYEFFLLYVQMIRRQMGYSANIINTSLCCTCCGI